MPLLNSTMLALGTEAPDFRLPDPDGKVVARDDFKGRKALLVLFICNHCPYVKHVRPELAAIGRDYQSRGVGIVAINSNDSKAYPADSPERMREEIREAPYTFPYLIDESQAVARAYRAACTPDIYLFNHERRLVYRGQIDDTRPDSGQNPNGSSLRAALDAVLSGRAVPEPQRPSIGCSIKWKPGNEPDY
jgi:peroxiredoxin